MNYTKGEWKVFVADHFVQIHTSKTSITLERSEENIANAQLIASAPKMYERLTIVLHLLEDWSTVLEERNININRGTLKGEAKRIKILLAKAEK